MAEAKRPNPGAVCPTDERARAETQCTLTLTNDDRLLPAILSFVRALSETFGFEQTAVDHIELAVEEAVVNVFRHAYGSAEQGELVVVVGRTATGFEFCVRDRGLPYDPTLTPEYRPEIIAEQQQLVGLGTFLIKRLMDEVEFRNLGMKGKEVRMLKYLASSAAFDTGTIATDDSPVELKLSELDIHLMRPSEAVEVSRCFYESYGYTYAGEHMYYPERVAALNDSGELISAVATVPQTGEVAAHMALVANSHLPGVVEEGKAATKPRFRGQAVAGSLGEFLLEEARNRGVYGVFGEAVTSHPYTQKFSRKLGFIDCGFVLAMAPDFTSFRGIAPELQQRESFALSFQFLQPAVVLPLYPPERHAAVIGDIYARLGAELCREPGPPPTGELPTSVLRTTISPLMSVAALTVETVGKDFNRRIRQELLRIKREKLSVAVVYLDMADPHTARVANELEDLGFLFTGVIPCAGGHDRLIMQFFNGVVVDYDSLVLNSNEAKNLLTYLRANDPQVVD